MSVIEPGQTVGILGGGQLGRMMAMAAARLGIKCFIYAPKGDNPATQVCDGYIEADYDDVSALEEFASKVDVITFEFENIPAKTAEVLAAKKLLYPQWRALALTQDRLVEKDFINTVGAPTAPYHNVESLADLKTAVEKIGLPAVLKTRRFGYDGKGQATIKSDADIEDAWAAMNDQPSILEGFIDFDLETSVVIARSATGEARAWPMSHNIHRNHILDETIIPAPITDETQVAARDIASRLVSELEYVGVLAVELFVKADGSLIVNEIAPRVHNSGHWTLDGAVTSQFEQHIRAVCSLPLGDTSPVGPRVIMKNLIGFDADQWHEILNDPTAHLHLYGKTSTREGRKMGHVTWVKHD